MLIGNHARHLGVDFGQEDDKNSHAAMHEIKFGDKDEKVIAGPRDWTAASVFNHLESVALAIEGSDLNISEDNFVPTARCIQEGNW